MALNLRIPDPRDYGNQPGQGPLRPGGFASAEPVTVDADLPSTWSPEAKAQKPALGVVRDLWGGTDQLRNKGTAYLPKGPGERWEDYNPRLARSVFFNAFRRTVEGLTGLVFRKDPELGDDVPPQIVEQWENIDNAGTHGDVFCRDLLTDALVAGHCAILVDFPSTGGKQSAAVEMSGGVRPYWVVIRKDDIVSWRTTVEAGRHVLTQVVLRECSLTPDGRYGTKVTERYRVLYRDGGTVGWALLEITPDRRVVEVASGLYGNQVEIPLAEIVTSGKRSMFESDPPLYDLAHLNIAHYQQLSDYRESLHKTSVPLLCIVGGPEPLEGEKREILVGPNTCLWLPNPEASAMYVSHDGAALGSVKASLDDLKSDMGTLGVAMLAPQKRTAETAEAKRLDKATSDSALSVTARGLQDGIERALDFHARYLRLPSGGSIEINRDFEGLTMDPAVMTAFASLIAQGLPWDIALDQLQKGGRVAEDVDVETMALEIATARAAQQEYEREQAQLNGLPHPPAAA